MHIRKEEDLRLPEGGNTNPYSEAWRRGDGHKKQLWGKKI